jgi:hypothetical protein
MRRTTFLLLLPALVGQGPPASDGTRTAEASKAKRERLLAIYGDDAASYTIYRDASRKEKLELQPDPVYVWTNPTRSGGQDGAVFVWTWRGRAEVVGCIFSNPATGPRDLNHEFQSLATTVLDVTRPPPHTWTPEGPGVDLTPIPGAPPPAASAKARLVQMRALTRDFTASTLDKQEVRWELRTLPKPLYRYESTDPEVLDGAVFGFVSSAGTDLEALLVIEARRPAGGGDPVWRFGAGRFTDLDLWARHKGQEVYTAPRYEWNGPRQDVKHRYRAFKDRDIPPVEDDEATKPVADRPASP